MNLRSLRPATATAPADILAGLRTTPKRIPCKYFYDEAGAQLFERICSLPEYYPTRTEIGIMRDHMQDMVDWIGTGARIVEFGSGSGEKTRILLGAVRAPEEYVPVDICAPQLIDNAAALRAAFPALTVRPLHADYTRPLKLQASPARRTIVYFPGSTIGNFEPLEAVEFLRRAARLAGAGGGLLIGVDLKKDTLTLERAYNDQTGVTAAFNLNMLAHVNRLAGADFDPSGFTHVAHYNQAAGRIEMRLRSRRAQTVTLSAVGDGPYCIDFEAGELIETEHSYKYSIAEFRRVVELSGFTLKHTWADPERLFSVHACDVASFPSGVSTRSERAKEQVKQLGKG